MWTVFFDEKAIRVAIYILSVTVHGANLWGLNYASYLENMDPLISYDEELFNRLTSARNTDELHDAKCAVLRDFHDIYTFDASDAEFPEPVGHFDDEGEKIKFIRKKISLQDIALRIK